MHKVYKKVFNNFYGPTSRPRLAARQNKVNKFQLLYSPSPKPLCRFISINERKSQIRGARTMTHRIILIRGSIILWIFQICARVSLFIKIFLSFHGGFVFLSVYIISHLMRKVKWQSTQRLVLKKTYYLRPDELAGRNSGPR